MRTPFIVLVAAASLLAPYAAFAGDDTTPQTAATPAVATGDTSKDDDQIVCHREKLTGTLLPGPKVCKPLKIWRQQQEDSKDLLNGLTTGNLHTNPKGG